MSDMQDTLHFLRVITMAIVATKDADDTKGKQHLWMAMMAIITNIPLYHNNALEIGFIHCCPRIFCSDYGILLYTVQDLQVTFNLLIPHRAEESTELMTMVLSFIGGAYTDYAIDMRPLTNHVDGLEQPLVTARRFVASRKYVRAMHLKGEYVVCGDQSRLILRRLTSIHDVVNFRPLTTLSDTDHIDTVYWHRFECGTIATLHNPTIDILETIALPESISDGTILRNAVPVCILPFIKQLTPTVLSECTTMMQALWIPMSVRRFCATIAKANFGIQDDLIVAVGMYLGKVVEKDSNVNVANMYCMYRIMCCAKQLSHLNARLVDSLCTTIPSFHDQLSWRKWMLHSKFIYACVDSVNAETVSRMCQRFSPFRHVLAFLLSVRIGTWSAEERKKAFILMNAQLVPVSDEDPIVAVRAEFSRLASKADTLAEELERMEGVPLQHPHAPISSSTKAVPKRLCKDADNHGDDITMPVHRTHHSIVTRIQQHIGFPCELIGSGIFFDDSDVDIVITVPASETLSTAYEHIQQITGWNAR